MKRFKKLFIVLGFLGVLGFGSLVGIYLHYSSTLPPLFSVEDYNPLLVSEVYARNGEKIGEFYRENRKLVPIEEIPKDLINAFLSAEDSSFYSHRGFNLKGMLRALIANLTKGKKTQGASTITQQTARTLFLSSEKTYTRKLKEFILAIRMERHLSKENILYLYLNQIYFGQGAYGVASAAEIFFGKQVKDLHLAEMALLAGSLTAPSTYNVVANPQKAKARQHYVLTRMLKTGRINQFQFDSAINEVLVIKRKKKFKEVAPYFVETIRQLLVKELGEPMVLDKGLKIYSSLDFVAQEKAQNRLREGLRELDKRQGFRGAKQNIDIKNEDLFKQFLTKERNRLIDKARESFRVFPDGSTDEYGEFAFYQEKDEQGQTLSNIPPYAKLADVVEAVVTEVDDTNEVVFVRFAEAQGLIPLEQMSWARKPNPNLVYGEYLHIKKPSEALNPGDVIDVKILSATFTNTNLKPSFDKNPLDYAELALEQEPKVEAALISYDLKTEDVIAMVGGSDFKKTKLNRSYQAVRQTGSSFKPILYAAGLDHGLTPISPIMGAPIVYNQQTHEENSQDLPEKSETSPNEEQKTWKPGNYGGRFTGDILLRNALKKSMNTPSIRILEKTGIPFVAEYAKRLGVFSPINMDMSTALGSSGATLYEMTKAYSVFARLGKNIKPTIIHEIKDRNEAPISQLISLNQHFQKEIDSLQQEFAKKQEEYNTRALASNEENQTVSPFFFKDPNQLISPQTAYLITTLLQAVVNESGGTGAKARRLQREIAGKTGTTNGYHDAWFIGYTPQVSTGVWVGYDHEQSLGRGETGSRAALPIWLNYMEDLLQEVPKENFSVPDKIVFANIDNETGQLATARSRKVVRQAFFSGTEPGLDTEKENSRKEEEDRTNFYRQEF